MKVTGVLLMVCLAVVRPHKCPDFAAVVHGPVALPCNCSGQTVEWKMFHPITKSIAECDHGKCQIQLDFQKRFSILVSTSTGNYTMSINSTFYNDIGLYRCSCDGESVSEGRLNVYDPRNVTAVKGENVTLPCYGDTRRDANDVQWKKDGTMLLQFTNSITGETSGGRFTMSRESFLGGDLSLHISSVELSDAGLYLCLIHGESRDGDPRAVLLTVEEPEQRPPTAPNCNTQLALAVTLGLLLLGLIIYSGAYHILRFYESSHNQEPGPSVQEENPMLPKPSSTQPIQD